MSIKAKYSHTNLIAEDWKKLAEFYEKIFGCQPIPPERNYEGEKLESGTGLKNIRLQGIHLKLPGYEHDGPTLEIFTYTPLEKKSKSVNSSGYGHIAFQVENVSEARDIVLNSGGKPIGEIVTLETSAGAKVTWCYVADPEGNIIELQRWD
jgi:predicted enzyme related to lactoylglutathione lyase